MKVLHIIPSIAPVRGGPSQAVIQMVRHLRQQQIQAEIVTTDDNGAVQLSVPLNSWTLASEVPVRYFSRYSPTQSSLREFGISPGLTRWLWRHLSEYDVVHIHALFSYPCLAGMLLARTRGVPYILRPLGSLCRWSLKQSPRKKQWYLQLSRSLLNHAAALHFTSQAEAEEAAALQLTAKPWILPLGIEVPQQLQWQPNSRSNLVKQLNCPSEHPVLLFMSRLHPKKGLEILLQALADLPHRNFTLAVAGSGDPDYCQQLREQVARQSLQAQVRWLGFVQGTTKQQLLTGADGFVLPSYSENFGIVVLEALAAGLPVITTPGVALEQVLLKHRLGWVIPPQVEAWRIGLAEILPQLLPNIEQSLRRDDRGRRVVETEFAWPGISKKLAEQYARLIGTQPKQI